MDSNAVNFRLGNLKKTCHIVQVLLLIFVDFCLSIICFELRNQDETHPLNKPPKLSNCVSFLFGNTTNNTQKARPTACSFHWRQSVSFFSIGFDITLHLGPEPASSSPSHVKNLRCQDHSLKQKSVDLVICWMTEIDGGWIFDTCWTCLLFCLGGKKASGA